MNTTTPTNLFTIGYEGRSIKAFIEELQAHRISYVLDVREKPISRKKGFSRNALSLLLKNAGIEYIHMKELGSPGYLRNMLHASCDCSHFFQKYQMYLKSQRDSLGTVINAVVMNKDKNFCLMCFEKDVEKCHRKIIVEAMLSINPDIGIVEHL